MIPAELKSAIVKAEEKVWMLGKTLSEILHYMNFS